MILLKNNKGFTYAEVIIALAIIILFIGFFISFDRNKFEVRNEVEDLNKVTMVAQGVMDTYRKLGKAEALTRNQGYAVNITEDTNTGHTGLVKVTVTVTPKVSGASDITLVSYETTAGSGGGGGPDMTGSGTQVDPYIIWTLAGLDQVRNNLTAYYELGTNIDASPTITWNGGQGWIPIGDSITPFVGNFDGKGFEISNLYINRPATDYVGVFGDVYYDGVNPGNVQGVKIINADITGGSYVGALAGYLDQASASLIGASGAVNGNIRVGGIFGHTSSGGVDNSYSLTSVTGGDQTGGLIGTMYDGMVTNSYSTGLISGSTNVGGLIGKEATKVFSPLVLSSYWDIDTSGQATSAGGSSLTDAQMKQQSSYSGWDFTNVWGIDGITNSGYPYLR